MKASLECRVQSAIQSEIMWLKQLEHPSEVGSSQGSGSIIDLGTDKFKILEQQKGTGGLDAPDRQTFVQTLISASEEGVEYLNTMIIDAAVPTDAGTYYCFVKNPLGYKFKGAYLNVIPSKQQHSKSQNRMTAVLAMAGTQAIQSSNAFPRSFLNDDLNRN